MLFLIPLRRYFVREMHGAFPYPEGTAITEVLVTGEKGGSQAKLLLQATGIAAVYDFLVSTFQVWREVIDLQFLTPVKALGEKARMVMGFDALSFILGLGYVMGLRSSMVLCAGGLFANWVLVPLVFFIGQHHPEAIYPGNAPIATLAAGQIFRSYVRFIGVGAIATAGIFGIVKSMKILWGSLAIAAKTFKQGEDHSLERTDRDLPIVQVLIGLVAATVLAGVFYTTLGTSLTVALVGLALTLGFSFLFASVAANAIATTARNPVSGMTMLTIIVSSVVLLKFGLSGTTGMFFVMAIAGMVCTALSVSGQTITDLKIGYWLGSTPAAQLRVKFLGVAVSAIAASLTIMVLAKTFQFGEAGAGRRKSGAGGAPGLDHGGAHRRIHEPAAGCLPALRGGRADRPDHGDAGSAGAALRARHVPAARAQHPGAGRRHPAPLRDQALERHRRRGRPQHARARHHHRLGPDGRRRPGRRLRRVAAAARQLQGRVDQESLLRQRSRPARSCPACFSSASASTSGSARCGGPRRK